MGYALFSEITQRGVVILYRCFGKTYPSHIQAFLSDVSGQHIRPSSRVRNPWRWYR